MRWGIILAFAVVLVFAAAFASAAPIPPTNLQVLSSDSREMPNASTGAVDAQGGNITNLNIDALSITKTWQGYYGNVTGNIHLDDANNNSFYVWGNGSSLNGQIYATRNNSPQWATVNCTTGTQRALEESYLGVASTDGDSVTNTFNKTSHPAFFVGLQPIAANTCLSTNGLVNGTIQNATFHQLLLSDQLNNTIYTTMIAYHQYGYNGQVMDFQLLVGENEHPGNVGPTPYYFFVELN